MKRLHRSACIIATCVAAACASAPIRAQVPPLPQPGEPGFTATTSISHQTVYHDTQSDAFVTTYSTQILGILDGVTTVYDLTLSASYADAMVQNALLAAQAALTGAGAISLGSPVLSGPFTTTLAPQISTSVDATVVEPSITTASVSVGSVLIYTGDWGECTFVGPPPPGQSDNRPHGQYDCAPTAGTPLQVVPGEINTNTNVHTVTDIYRSVTTTHNTLVSAVYTVAGSTGTPTSVPEPGTLALMLAGLAGTLALASRRARIQD